MKTCGFPRFVPKYAVSLLGSSIELDRGESTCSQPMNLEFDSPTHMLLKVLSLQGYK